MMKLVHLLEWASTMAIMNPGEAILDRARTGVLEWVLLVMKTLPLPLLACGRRVGEADWDPPGEELVACVVPCCK